MTEVYKKMFWGTLVGLGIIAGVLAFTPPAESRWQTPWCEKPSKVITQFEDQKWKHILTLEGPEAKEFYRQHTASAGIGAVTRIDLFEDTENIPELQNVYRYITWFVDPVTGETCIYWFSDIQKDQLVVTTNA